MARHIMAVCVVCLLCADRLPCQQHFEGGNLFAIGTQPESQSQQKRQTQQPSIEYMRLNARVVYSPPSAYSLPNRNKGQRYDPTTELKNDLQDALPPSQSPLRSRRLSRHATHNVPPPRPEITGDFLHRLFAEYGQGDGTISIGAFQRMLRQLGLHQLVEQKYAVTAIRRNATNDACIADTTLVEHVQDKDHPHHVHAHTQPLVAANCSGVSCTEDGQNDSHHHNYTLSEQDMLNLCPVLLYQLASPLEAKRAGCIERSVIADIDVYEATMAADLAAGKDDNMYVWIYAFISVFACGILGLVGVAIIPFMDSRYYNKIIQFLVSLAVGTMTGDALLHLLPHSLAGQTESNMIFKGLTCMGGIVFFYITEHGFTMISEWRKRIAKQETKNPSRAKVVRDPDSSVNNSVVGDKLCKSKYSSYPYCYDEITMDTKNDVHIPTAQRSLQSPHHGASPDHGHALATLAQLEHETTANNVELQQQQRKWNGHIEAADAMGESAAAAQSLLSTSHNNYAPMTELNHHHQYHHHHFHPHQHQHHHIHQVHHHDGGTVALCTDLDSNSLGADGAAAGAGTGVAANGNSNNANNGNTNGSTGVAAKEVSGDTVTVILREHESSHHGHSHKHGHVHSPPESLSAVAWMIIMGDGLHNFTDGMAIGAAFAENIAGGFSTSLAVFCHELPHELGDFAILMKAGMSVKSAVYYNLLTGVLSFIGMIVGIVFGQSQETAQWMFAAAAGLFIYIALVDMMPELSSSHKSLEQFILQILGMCSGISLMLLIAIYEGDLMNVFAVAASGASAPAAAGHRH